MRKLLIVVWSALLLLGLALPGLAQEETNDDWFIYLMDVNSYSLLRVNSDGSQSEFPLPLPPNTYFGPISSGFGADGRFLVFCSTEFASAENPTPSWITYVIDVFEGTVLRTFEFGGVNNCMASMFSDDASKIGVGLLNRFPGDPNADTSLPIWTLQIYDVVSGEMIAELDANDPAAADVNLGAFGAGPGVEHPVLPRAIQISDDSVTFQAFPGVGMDGPPELNTYYWDIAANTVEELVNRGSLAGDFLVETGQTVSPRYDESFPALDPGGPLPAYNTLDLTDVDGTTRAIYQNTEKIIVNAKFVNDGQAIVVTLLDAFDPNQPTQNNTLVLIDLDGNVLREVGQYLGYVQTFAAPGGFVMIRDLPQELGPPGFSVEYFGADGTSRELWHYDANPDEVGTFWQLLHIQS